MLKGSDLLAKVREMDGASKTELVMACGYHSTKKDGTTRLNFTAFYESLLEAKGMSFDGSSNGAGGRRLSHVCKVQFNGNLLVGKAYVLPQGHGPGDEFEIRARRGGGFVLVPMGSSDAPEGAGEAEQASNVAAPPVPDEDEEDEDEEDDSEEVRARVLDPAAAQRELAGVA